jgi:transposase-like protein
MATTIIGFFIAGTSSPEEKGHVNGIKAFWSFAKRRLAKFNGLNDENFIMHLKECEFRYNNRDKDLVKILTKMVGRQKKMLV